MWNFCSKDRYDHNDDDEVIIRPELEVNQYEGSFETGHSLNCDDVSIDADKSLTGDCKNAPNDIVLDKSV